MTPSVFALDVEETQQQTIQIETFRTHSRLRFIIDGSVTPQWRDVAGGFELTLKGLSVADFGAQQIRILKNTLKDTRLAGVDFREDRNGLVVRGTYKFPTGDDAPANKIMERFEFREQSPSAVVFDFWQKKGPTVADVRFNLIKQNQIQALKKAEDSAKFKIERRLAFQKAIDNVSDLGKFCKEPLSAETDIFLPFSAVHEDLNIQKYFPITTADNEYPYREPKGKERDAQYVKLALALYEAGKPALVLRTVDFLIEEFPKSPFIGEMKFLKANAYIRLGMMVQANQIFEELTLKYKGNPVALHSGVFLAINAFLKKEYLKGLEGFYWLIRHYPEHRLNWLYHFGAAESLYHLRQVDRAVAEYQWVIKHSTNVVFKADAAFRIGDLYLGKRQYDQALAAYYKAIRDYEKEAARFPVVYLNRAEALYWLGQYDRAQEAFQSYLNRFPNDPNGWRATYRMAELYGRKAGHENAVESRKWYYATINQYPTSPAVTLARLRLLPCGDHGGFEISSSDRFLEKEALKYDGRGEVVTDGYMDYFRLAHMRTYVMMGREEEAVALGVRYMDETLSDQVKKSTSAVFKKAFRKSILKLIAQNRKLEAVAFYNKYVKNLPRDDNPLVPDFVLKLSQAASDMNMGHLAESLVESYKKVNESESTKRAIASNKDSLDGIDERLRNSEESFSEAKALWVKNREKSEAVIRDKLDHVSEESQFSDQKELILGSLELKAGRFTKALAHYSKAKLLKPSRLPEDTVRLDLLIAELKWKGNEIADAVEMFSNSMEKIAGLSEKGRDPSAYSDILTVLGVPDAPSFEQLVMDLGDRLEQKSDWSRASMIYEKGLTMGLQLPRIKYLYARSLRKTEDKELIKKANNVLTQMAEKEKDEFWKQMAQESLKKEKL